MINYPNKANINGNDKAINYSGKVSVNRTDKLDMILPVEYIARK